MLKFLNPVEDVGPDQCVNPDIEPLQSLIISKNTPGNRLPVKTSVIMHAFRAETTGNISL